MCEEKQRWVESFVWSRLVSTCIFVLQDQRIHPVDRPPSGLSHAQDSVSRVERRLGPDAYGSNPRTPRRRRRRAARIAGCSARRQMHVTRRRGVGGRGRSSAARSTGGGPRRAWIACVSWTGLVGESARSGCGDSGRKKVQKREEKRGARWAGGFLPEER